MKEIKLSNGTDVAVIKDFCSRGEKKRIKNLLFGGTVMNQGEGGKMKTDGLSMKALEDANDLALTLLVEKLIIGGVEKLNLTVNDFDALDTRDFDIISKEVNLLVNPELPNA